MHSLRLRLLLMLVTVVIVAVGTSAALMSRLTSQQFDRFLLRDLERNQRLNDVLLRYAGADHDSADLPLLARQLAQIHGGRVLLADRSGSVLADSDGMLVGEPLPTATTIPALVLTLDRPLLPRSPEAGAEPDRTPAAALAATKPLTRSLSSSMLGDGPVSLPLEGLGRDLLASAFMRSVNQSLMLAATVAGLVALLLTWAISRRVLLPIERLTVAAQKMEGGDLSQRVRIHTRDEIGVLGHAFNAMADGLARLEQARRNMGADVAHELRTPLTNLRGYLEALRDGVAQPEPALFDSLCDEALLLNRLVDDLQDLALAEAGQLRLARRPWHPRRS